MDKAEEIKAIEEEMQKLQERLEVVRKVEEQPEKYCGLTEEQWQRVIDEEFFVTVSDSSIEDAASKYTGPARLHHLSKFYTDDRHLFDCGMLWRYCAVVRRPGIRQPNFGEKPDLPCDTEVFVKFRSGSVATRLVVELHWEHTGLLDDIMEFVYLV